MVSVYTEPCRNAAIEAKPIDAVCPRADRRWVLAATIMGSSMAFIDGTVVNVTLPIIQADLGASVSEMQWIIESYALLLATLILVGGAMGDRYGRRRMFAIGAVLFGLASLWCGLAGTTLSLILARAAQGLGAAFLIPGSLALIAASFPKEERGRAIGTWSAASALTMAVGPVLGGWLAETFSWRWIFFINIPFAVLVVTIALARVPESTSGDRAPLDWPGAALCTLGLAGVTFALIHASHAGLGDPLVVASGAFGLAVLAGFLHHQQVAAHPIVPPSLFHSATFTGANVLTFFVYAALGFSMFVLPLNLIQVQGTTAAEAAAIFLPFVAVMALGARYTGSLSDRFGPRPLLIAGPAITGLGYLVMMIPGQVSSIWLGFLPAMFVMAVGMVLTVSPLTNAVMSSVDDRNSGLASGTNNAVSRVAALIAIAALGLVFTVISDTAFLSALPPGLDLARDFEGATPAFGAIPPAFAAIPAAELSVIEAAADAAFVEAFRFTIGVCAGLTFVGAIAALFWIDRPPRAGAA